MLVIALVLVISAAASANDITGNVFGNVSHGVSPAAFGDFNSDKLTDIFVIRDDAHAIEVLLANAKEPIMQSSNLTCYFTKGSITSVVPGDFDGDAVMDILVTTLETGKNKNTSVFILWGAQDSVECPTDESHPVISTKDQPLVLDVNQDMISDLFGMTSEGKRMYWVFGPNRTAPREQPMKYEGRDELRFPHSHAFVDIDGDFVTDLVLTTQKGFEVWNGAEHGDFSFNRSFNYPEGVKEDSVGQNLFLDVALNSHLELVLPVCFNERCENSTIFIYDGVMWRDLRPNFKDPQGNTWGFVKPDGRKFTDVITPRGGDFNLDGYPDLLVTLTYQSAIRTVLLENIHGPNGRTFSVQWTLLGANNNTVAGAFFDFYQKGIMDVLLVQRITHDKQDTSALIAFKNGLDYDANFLKSMCLNNVSDAKQLEVDSYLLTPKDYYPTHFTDINQDVLFLKTYDRHDVHEMMLDPMLYKGVKLSEFSPTAAVQIEWSPPGVADVGCTIAIRTSSGAVIIYMWKDTKWKELADLSISRYDQLKPCWDLQTLQKDDFECLKSRSKQLQATAMCWGGGNGNEEPVLWVAYGNGSMVAWTGSGASVNGELTNETENSISHISWYCGADPDSEFLLVGDLRGKCQAHFVKREKVVELWGEEDLIAVSDSLTFELSEDILQLLIVKGSCLVALAMEKQGKITRTGAKNFGTAGITGVIRQCSNEIIVSHQCGTIEKIKLKNANNKIEFVGEKVSHKINTKDCNLHGLGISRNGLILAASTSVFVAHDHLLLREPSRVVFFTTTSAKGVWPLLQTVAPDANLRQVWDIVELLRFGVDPSFWQQKDKIEEAKKIPVFYRRLLCLSLAYAIRQEEMNTSEYYKHLLEEHDAKMLATRILKTIQDLPPTLRDNETCSAILMKMWLKNFNKTHNDYFSDVSPEVFDIDDNISEACSICGNELEFSEGIEMVCEKSHRLPRCCLSLLQCNTPPFRTCEVCNLCCLLNPPFGLDPICLLCKLPMGIDDL